jgi:predicted NBD/HSP70 family sugar kinase
MKLRPAKKEEKQIANLQRVKETNLALLFQLIYSNSPVSRAELAQTTGLSPTTVSSLVSELLENNLIMEKGAGISTTSGRKPIMLEINPLGSYVFSIELREKDVVCSLYDIVCQLVDSEVEEVRDFMKIGRIILQLMSGILQKKEISKEKICGICVGAPALIDVEAQKIIASTIIPIDADNDFITQLREAFPDAQVHLENESGLSAYAEKEFGGGTDTRNIIYIDIGTGIGAGIILNGKLYTGAYGLAGEVGHMSIDLDGPRCKCGNKGCFEIMAGIPALTRKVLLQMMSGRETVMSGMVGTSYQKINTDLLVEAYRQKDIVILEAMDEITFCLASGINNVINLFNPQVVVLGGEMIRFGSSLLEKIQETLNAIALRPNLGKVDVRFTKLGAESSTLGGARYTLDKVYHMNGMAEGML